MFRRKVHLHFLCSNVRFPSRHGFVPEPICYVLMVIVGCPVAYAHFAIRQGLPRRPPTRLSNQIGMARAAALIDFWLDAAASLALIGSAANCGWVWLILVGRHPAGWLIDFWLVMAGFGRFCPPRPGFGWSLDELCPQTGFKHGAKIETALLHTYAQTTWTNNSKVVAGRCPTNTNAIFRGNPTSCITFLFCWESNMPPSDSNGAAFGIRRDRFSIRNTPPLDSHRLLESNTPRLDSKMSVLEFEATLGIPSLNPLYHLWTPRFLFRTIWTNINSIGKSSQLHFCAARQLMHYWVKIHSFIVLHCFS